MPYAGTVTRFGNLGFGFVKLDCNYGPRLGNRCEDPMHGKNVYIHLSGLRFVDWERVQIGFHPDPNFGREFLPLPKQGNRVVLLIGHNDQGLIGRLWTYEALWKEAQVFMLEYLRRGALSQQTAAATA